eukprot:scaffold3535_cov107-Isochrysis_galbana.AAC.6
MEEEVGREWAQGGGGYPKLSPSLRRPCGDVVLRPHSSGERTLKACPLLARPHLAREALGTQIIPSDPKLAREALGTQIIPRDPKLAREALGTQIIPRDPRLAREALGTQIIPRDPKLSREALGTQMIPRPNQDGNSPGVQSTEVQWADRATSTFKRAQRGFKNAKDGGVFKRQTGAG